MVPSSLRARLLVAFVMVAAGVLVTVGAAVLIVGPHYFSEAMGHLPGDPMGLAMGMATQMAFVDAMRRALLAATVVAVLTAIVVSLAVAARIARPVTRLADASRRIAAGHYAERVDTDEPGEIAELAASFNEMAASLEATERRRIQLVGDVAHELRTPLSTLDGYLEGLEDGVVSPSPQTWHLLRAETARLTRMVNELAELWRAEAHQLPLHAEDLDAAEVAREVAARFAPKAASRDIAIAVPTSPVDVTADRDRVAQILSNYLSNALRHSPDGARIEVRAYTAKGRGRLSVTDHGTGLAADQLEAVFERFYRVDSARTRASGGAGIGLAIVRALADAMGGQAWAESAGPGSGATFIVDLPAA
ncbi:MAG: sensor histidine kinase [Candidatus Limnocylindrales bacterium]